MTYEHAQMSALLLAKYAGHLVAAVYTVDGLLWRATSHADVLLVDIDVPVDAIRIDYSECLNGHAMTEWQTLRQLEVAA